MSGNDIANLVTLVFVLVIVYIGVMFRLAERQVERERSEELDRKLDALLSCSRCGRRLGFREVDTCNACAAQEGQPTLTLRE